MLGISKAMSGVGNIIMIGVAYMVLKQTGEPTDWHHSDQYGEHAAQSLSDGSYQQDTDMPPTQGHIFHVQQTGCIFHHHSLY